MIYEVDIKSIPGLPMRYLLFLIFHNYFLRVSIPWSIHVDTVARFSIWLCSINFWLFISSQLFLADGFYLSCSFPALSCEFASVDVSDVLGTVSFNYSICTIWSSLAIYIFVLLLKKFCSLRFFKLLNESFRPCIDCNAGNH